MATKPPHAFDYLARPERHPPRPVCAVFGDETFLRREVQLRIREAVLGGADGELSLSKFEGRTAELRDVLDELATVAMFGGGRRLVVVSEADEFVSRYRSQLEDYVAGSFGGARSASPRPDARPGVLLLELNSFAKNTRLYKAVVAEGLAVDCGSPSAARLAGWLAARAREAHQVELPQAAAELLVELVGPELGLLDQELAKLALLTGPEARITPELVGRSVRGWRAKTTWDMLDAALAGDFPSAMTQLDRLLASGENPIGLLAQVSASLRRLAAATRLVLQAKAAGRPTTPRAALQQAGIKPFLLGKAQRQLRHLGEDRARYLYRWLLQADLDLKGASALPPRLILERLIARLAIPRDTGGLLRRQVSRPTPAPGRKG